MSRKLPNYLKTHRKRIGFTQEEIAFLLGCKSGAKISRYETFQNQPSLKTLFSYRVVLRLPVEDLFAGIFQEAEETTLKQAQILIRELEFQENDLLAARKRDHLYSLFK